MQPLNRTPHTTERGYVLTFLYRLQALQDQLNADLMTHAAYHARRDALRAQARRAVVSGRVILLCRDALRAQARHGIRACRGDAEGVS
jgi:hypothetical protein